MFHVMSAQGFEGAFNHRKDAEGYARELVERIGIGAWIEIVRPLVVEMGVGSGRFASTL